MVGSLRRGLNLFEVLGLIIGLIPYDTYLFTLRGFHNCAYQNYYLGERKYARREELY